MTLSELIESIRNERKDSKSVTDRDFSNWISRVEFQITNPYGQDSEMKVYDNVCDANDKLALPDEYIKIYKAYIYMMLDIFHDNPEKYRKDKRLFDVYSLEYIRRSRLKNNVLKV